jgi:hypothetical protein
MNLKWQMEITTSNEKCELYLILPMMCMLNTPDQLII